MKSKMMKSTNYEKVCVRERERGREAKQQREIGKGFKPRRIEGEEYSRNILKTHYYERQKKIKPSVVPPKKHRKRERERESDGGRYINMREEMKTITHKKGTGRETEREQRVLLKRIIVY